MEIPHYPPPLKGVVKGKNVKNKLKFAKHHQILVKNTLCLDIRTEIKEKLRKTFYSDTV
jgi:hypothetical protein